LKPGEGPGELLGIAMRHTNKRSLGVGDDREMTVLLICLSAATPIAGLGLVELQARLERWDYERHAQD
jgi:hypothetical protein